MKNFLFTWNPRNWPWDLHACRVAEVSAAGNTVQSWSCGNRRHLDGGSRIFLARVGEEPRGIIGSGTANAPPRLDDHWDPVRARAGERIPYVDVEFDRLWLEPIVSVEELRQPLSIE